MDNGYSYAQLLVIEDATKKEVSETEFMDNWNEYDDYSDCHGDYYDAE